MHLLIMGPPGAGKGTQSAFIKERFNLSIISSGDMLRSAVKERTELGVQAEQYMKSGGLVPDDLMIDLILSEVDRVMEEGKEGVLLDGFPRTVNQAEALGKALYKKNITLKCAIRLAVDADIVVSRLAGREVCPVCNNVYHVKTNPPRQKGICNYCSGVKLIVREDDKESVIRNRLEVYEENTHPVAEFYRRKKILFSVDGTLPMEEVRRLIFEKLEKF